MRSRSHVLLDTSAKGRPRSSSGTDLHLIGDEPEDQDLSDTDLSDTSGPMVLRVPDLGRPEELPGDENEAEASLDLSPECARNRGERLTMMLTLSALVVIVSALSVMIWSGDRTSNDPPSLVASSKSAPRKPNSARATVSQLDSTASTRPRANVGEAGSEESNIQAADVVISVAKAAGHPSPIDEASDAAVVTSQTGEDMIPMADAEPRKSPLETVQSVSTRPSPEATGDEKDIDLLLASVETALAERQVAERDYAAAAEALDNVLESHYTALLEAEKMLSFAREREQYEENRLKRAEVLVRRGHLSAVQRDSIAFALDRARIELAQAQASRDRLAQGPGGTEPVELQAKRDAAAAKLQSTRAKYMVASAELEQRTSSREDQFGAGEPSYASAASSREAESNGRLPIHESSLPRPSTADFKVADRRPGPATYYPNATPRRPNGAAANSGVTALPDLATETTYYGDSR